jgi:hypothetical protein
VITGGGGGVTTDNISLAQQIQDMPQGSLRSFLEKMLPVAQYVNSETGISRRLLLAQYTIESGEGTSEAARLDNNYAGIEPWGSYGPGPDSAYAGFSSAADFGQGQAAFYNDNSNYRALEAAGKAGESINQQAVLLGESGYAASGYRASGGGPGSSLIEEVASIFGGSVGTAGTGGQFPSGQKSGASGSGHQPPPSVWDVIATDAEGVIATTVDSWWSSFSSLSPVEGAAQIASAAMGWLGDFIRRMLLTMLFGGAALVVLFVLLSKAGVSIPIPIPV